MKRISQLFLVCPVLLLASFANAQASFHLLPSPVGPTWSSYSLSNHGEAMAANYGGEIFRWTPATGFVDLGSGDFLSSAVGISGDGNTILASRIGPDGNVNPAIWQQATGWVNLGHPSEGCVLDGSWGSGYGLNGDGTIAVGLAWYCPGAEGFQWTQQDGMVGLGHPSGASSRASAISSNGTVIVGFYEDPSFGNRRPVRWLNGTTDLFAGDAAIGEATAVSADGTQIAGQATTAAGGIWAMYYTDQGGMISLGTLSGKQFDQSFANGIGGNGKVVGWSGDPFAGTLQAFIWTPQAGMASLQQVLTREGAKIPKGVTLTTALAISGDGKTIVGLWSDNRFDSGAWMARLSK